MNPEELKEILAIDQENNALLKKLLRAQVIQNWMKGAYIFIMIAFVWGGYVFLKPMLSNLIATYQNMFNMASQIQNTAVVDTTETSVNMEKFNEILKTLK